MPKNTNYTTQDYGLANWLVFNRVILLGTVEYSGDTKKHFVFEETDSIPALIEEWGPLFSLPNSEPARTCKKFFQAHSVVKKALRESLDVSSVMSDN